MALPELEVANLVPVHPEAVADDDRSLRWSMPPGTLGFVGRPDRLPPTLQALLDAGTLESIEVEPAAVRTRLGEQRTWREHGSAVRSAVQSALASPSEWIAPLGATADDVLRMAALDVIAGQVGDYIRSHGGSIEVVEAAEDRVSVAMSGACSHCPASDFTLTQRFEVALRELYPALKAVTSVSDPDKTAGHPFLRLTALRRG